MRYESLFIDHHKHSRLPPACQRAIRAVRQALRGESVYPIDVALPKALDMVAQAFAGLPPEIIARAEQEIRFIADLWPHQRYYNRTNQLEYFKLIDREVAMLDGFPALAMLYLFHGDGRLRQAALHRISNPSLSPFLFAAITTRLNDWAPPVRQEAAACLTRIRSPEDLRKIAPAIPFLCVQSQKWQRWAENRAAYDRIEATPELAAYMVRHLCKSRQGPLAQQCYTMLRHPRMDPHLEQLALSAATPAVRVAAINALLNGVTLWSVGQKRVWIDKVYGVSRLKTVFDKRAVPPAINQAELALSGAKDRAVSVRRAVAYWLLTSNTHAPEVAHILAQDRYPSIRQIADLCRKRQAKNA